MEVAKIYYQTIQWKVRQFIYKKMLAIFGVLWYNVLYKGKDDRTVKDNSASLSDMDGAIF